MLSAYTLGTAGCSLLVPELQLWDVLYLGKLNFPCLATSLNFECLTLNHTDTHTHSHSHTHSHTQSLIVIMRLMIE